MCWYTRRRLPPIITPNLNSNGNKTISTAPPTFSTLPLSTSGTLSSSYPPPTSFETDPHQTSSTNTAAGTYSQCPVVSFTPPPPPAPPSPLPKPAKPRLGDFPHGLQLYALCLQPIFNAPSFYFQKYPRDERDMCRTKVVVFPWVDEESSDGWVPIVGSNTGIMYNNIHDVGDSGISHSPGGLMCCTRIEGVNYWPPGSEAGDGKHCLTPKEEKYGSGVRTRNYQE